MSMTLLTCNDTRRSSCDAPRENENLTKLATRYWTYISLHVWKTGTYKIFTFGLSKKTGKTKNRLIGWALSLSLLFNSNELLGNIILYNIYIYIDYTCAHTFLMFLLFVSMCEAF